MSEINYIIPELFLSISIMFLLLVGVFKKGSSDLIYKLSIFVFFITFILIFRFPLDRSVSLFNNSYVIDYFSSFMKILVLISTFFIMLSSYNYIKLININKIEYPILLLSSSLGMLVMISSYDLIVFYIGLELQSLSLYVLCAFNRENLRSSEAGLKYFVLSALSSGLLLYGSSLIYGFTSSTNFEVISNNLNSLNEGSIFGIVFILVGLAFKISAVPFHMWAPDVYEGSPTSVTNFFSMVPKVAALTVFIRFLFVPFINAFEEWQMIIIFISLASMIFGAVAAIGQKNLKRLMAYSSIGHMGYALAGLATGTNEGIQSSISYISIYLIMNLGIFSCIYCLKRKEIFYEDIEDLSGLSKNHPLISISLLILLFSLAGIPPLAGFFAKFYIFMSVINAKMYTFAVIGLVSTVISAFYYLRIIKIIYFDEKKEKFDIDKNFGLNFSIIFSTLIVLIYFLYPNILLDFISKIQII